MFDEESDVKTHDQLLRIVRIFLVLLALFGFVIMSALIAVIYNEFYRPKKV